MTKGHKIKVPLSLKIISGLYFLVGLICIIVFFVSISAIYSNLENVKGFMFLIPMFLLIAVSFLLISLGLFKLRKWAKDFAIVIAALSVAFSFRGIIYGVTLVSQPTQELIIRSWVSIIISVAIIITNLVILLVLTKKDNVKRAFELGKFNSPKNI